MLGSSLGTILLQPSANDLKNITVGYDKYGITHLTFETSSKKQTLGNSTQSKYWKTVEIDGTLYGVTFRSNNEYVNSIAFIYRELALYGNPGYGPVKSTESLSSCPGGTNFNKEYDGYYITKMEVFEDRRSIYHPWRITTIEFTFTRYDGTSTFVTKMGEGYFHPR